jgi:signal transduction histidine kinase
MLSPRRLFQSPSFWPLQIAGWSAYLVMIVVTFLPMLPPDRGMWALVQLKSVRTLVGFTLTCGLRVILRRFASGVAFVQAAVVVVSAAMVGGAAWMLTMKVAAPHTASEVSAPIVARWLVAPREAVDYTLTLLAWSALYLGLRWWQELLDQRERALEAAALAQQAQLDALRYQLNPHFLFNGLNSIRALIDEDAGRARRMITALSEFLRYPLTSAAGSGVPLATEIEALRNYLAIEKIRFEDRLHVTLDVSREAETAAIPSFLLHPLVENAITHGFSTPAPTPTLTIRVTARVRDGQLWLEVINSGRWKPTHDTADRRGTGTGLRNVQSRLAAIAPRAHHFSIEQQGDDVVVRLSLPYRPVGGASGDAETRLDARPSSGERDAAHRRPWAATGSSAKDDRE